MRKLVKTLLSLSLMAPAAALALGLGDVKLHSALNERLDADIELLSVDPAEVGDVNVSLASADTFSKLGLDRPAVLMNIKFDVRKSDDGKYYVKATTKDMIREPFLDFLVEVNWPSGRVLREYTLLLDPPVSHTETAPAVSTPGTEGAVAETKPMTQAGTTAPAPTSGQGAAAPTATYYPRPAEQAPMPQGAIVYGPVKSNDTLWRIAQKVRPNSDVSLQQVMMALLKSNPYAFFDNNVNRLKKGYVLRIDDPAMLTAMSKAEAAREVANQTRRWEDYRQVAAAKAAERQPAAGEEAPAGAAAAKSEPKLKLVAPEGQAKQAGASAGGQAAEGEMDEQLMLALESSAAQRKENEELQGRVNDLEEQLQDMQRLLALKDADLASLQKQLREQGQAVTLPSENAEKPLVSKPEGEKTATAEAEKAAEAPTAGAAMPAEAEKPAASEKMAEAEITKPDAAQAQQPKPMPKPKPKPKVKPQPAPEPSFLDSLLQNTMMLYIAGGAVVVILLLLLFMRSRRKGGFQESILSGGTSSMLNTKGDEGTGETSFLSDLAISGMGGGTITTDEGEVDPLTEADVFMAYGRNQQAEEVLKKALESNPDRPEVVAKLLEVYYSSKDKDQFDTLVATNAELLQGNDELWGKVAGMGHEISPDNALFADADTTVIRPQEPAAKSEPVTDDVLDIGLDLDELTAEMEGEAGDDSFDLGLDLGDEPQAEQQPEAESDGSMDMDFDLDLGEETEAPMAEAAPAAEESTDLDFDLGDLATESEAPAEEAAAADEMGDLDFDLGDFGAEAEEPAKAEDEPVGELDLSAEAEESATDLSDMDLGDLDFGSLDLETGSDESAGEAEVSLDLGELETAGSDLEDFGDLGDLDDESLLGDSDEITTKLDLAQAYIEMGDNEGARSMLEEVVEAGNDEQKQQAQDLLGKI